MQKKVTIDITFKGVPGSGKTRALRAMIQGLKMSDAFTVKETVGCIGSNGEEFQQLEVELLDPR
jgi:Ni2+-binding GTPase involved in maturation of urease and hydrogenase